MIDTSIWPLVASSIASLLIGYVWYHPKVFGEHWLRATNVSPEDVEQAIARRRIVMLVSFVVSFLLSYGMRTVLVAYGVGDFANAARAGAFLWLVFAVPVLLGGALWEHRRISLYTINAGYWLFAFVTMAVVLVF